MRKHIVYNENEQKVYNMFKSLEKNIGKKVNVEFSSHGNNESLCSKLINVRFYDGITVNRRYIPFIGSGCAIRSITSEEGVETLYNNPYIYNNYNVVDKDILNVIELFFYGENVALKKITRAKIKEEMQENEEKEFLRKLQWQKKSLINRGYKVIDESKRAYWAETVEKYTNDVFSGYVLKASILGMEKIDKGYCFDEIISDFSKMGLYGSICGYVVNIIVCFSKKGEEFYRYWYCLNDLSNDYTNKDSSIILEKK